VLFRSEIIWQFTELGGDGHGEREKQIQFLKAAEMLISTHMRSKYSLMEMMFTSTILQTVERIMMPVK